MKIAASFEQKHIRVAGIVGILAALAATCADISLQYSPTGQYGTQLEFLHISMWRLLLGHYLGIFAIPLLAIGYWQIAQALKPAGKWFSLPFFFLAAYSVAYGPAFHGLSTSVELIVQARQHTPIETQTVLTSLLNTTLIFSEPLAIVLLLNYLTVCTSYVIAVLFRPTLFPKWMALFNPFLLSLLITLFYYSNIFPPLGNLLFPGVLNISHVVFFTLSTVLLWNVERQALESTEVNEQKQAVSTSG